MASRKTHTHTDKLNNKNHPRRLPVSVDSNREEYPEAHTLVGLEPSIRCLYELDNNNIYWKEDIFILMDCSDEKVATHRDREHRAVFSYHYHHSNQD